MNAREIELFVSPVSLTLTLRKTPDLSVEPYSDVEMLLASIPWVCSRERSA
jgi:hypothetical protein